MLLRDKFWLWGHPEGRYNNEFGNTKASRMTPMECCTYLGLRNTFMVPVGVDVNKRQYNKSFTALNEVGWECFEAGVKPELIESYIEDAKDFSNIGSVVLDDFYRQKNYGKATLDNIWKISQRLHNNEVRPLNMWMVLYTHEFGVDEKKDADFSKFIEPFDGIIMWTWCEKDVPLIPEKYEIFKKLTPNKRRMFGCYLYNFGEDKQATGEAVKWQLDWYYKKLLDGEADGIVFHTNTMADLDYEAYDVAMEWIAQHGDEVI